MTIERAIAVALRRPRGIYVPAHEVEAHLACGWSLRELVPDLDEALLAPPALLWIDESEAA